jgi:predicted DNA binding CopG/RHH family protein
LEYKNGRSRGWPACPKEFHISLVLRLSHSWILHFPPTNVEVLNIYEEYSNNGVYKLQKRWSRVWLKRRWMWKELSKNTKWSITWMACLSQRIPHLACPWIVAFLVVAFSTDKRWINIRVTQPNLIEIKLKLSIECFNEDFFFKAH